MKVKVGFGLLCVIALLSTARAQAQIVYSDELYTSMADNKSSDTVPVGTAITLQNWQKYQHFMPQSMIAGYSQRYLWKVGIDPKYTINVGPTIPVPMFTRLRENTEKYTGQTKLRRVKTGGYTIEGYVAGLPFPKPDGPLKAQEILYNVWTQYYPSITYFDDGTMASIAITTGPMSRSIAINGAVAIEAMRVSQ